MLDLSEMMMHLQGLVDPSGSITTLSDTHGLFSDAALASGCYLVAGSHNVRTVLSNNEVFVHPSTLKAGRPAASLRSGLFEISGVDHAQQRKLISTCLQKYTSHNHIEKAQLVLTRHYQRLSLRDYNLVNFSKAATRIVFEQLIFGEVNDQCRNWVDLVLELQQLRKIRNSIADERKKEDILERIDQIGVEIDKVADRILQNQTFNQGLLSEIASAFGESATFTSPSSVITHITIVILSSIEPSAVVLANTLVHLWRNPPALAMLANQIRQCARECNIVPDFVTFALKESLRLTPPDAFMVRICVEDIELEGRAIPKGSELVVSPYITHRDYNIYEDAEHFLPQRWLSLAPPAYSYIPFGGGQRHCPGWQLSLNALRLLLDALLLMYDFEIREHARTLWRLNVALGPDNRTGLRLIQVSS